MGCPPKTRGRRGVTHLALCASCFAAGCSVYDAGLVEAVPRGRDMLYRLARQPTSLDQVRAYVDRVSRAWDRALESFKAFAESEETE